MATSVATFNALTPESSAFAGNSPGRSRASAPSFRCQPRSASTKPARESMSSISSGADGQ